MAQDFSQYSAGNGFTGFNYGSEADKIKRQRALADQLAQTTQQADKPQFVQNNMGTFYAGANSTVTGIAKVLGALLASKDMSDADQSQQNLDKTSAVALANGLQHLNDGHTDTTTRDDYSPAKDSQAANVIDEAQNFDPNTARTSPVKPQTPDNSVPLPLTSPPVPPQMQAQLGQQLSGQAPVAAPVPAGAAGTPQGNPGPQGPMAVPPVAPPRPMPIPQPQGPTQPQVLDPAPGSQPMEEPPLPQAPQIDPAQVIAQANPGTKTTTATTTPATDAELVSRLAALAQTGPMGAQIAQQQLQNVLGSKNGRYTTTVHADPVNGGFVAVRTDTRTGQTDVQPINAGTGHGKFTETTAEDGTRMKVYANGAPSEPVVDSKGNVVKDANVIKANHESEMKVAQAVSTNKSAQAAIDSALTRLDRIEQLGKSTITGPIMGHLPNYTKDRQELSALMAQDVFAETRDAVSAAGDSGGAPKMAQSEFQYMKDNGGLSMNMDPEVRSNLIAQQKIKLLALKQSLAEYGGALPQVSSPSGAPVGGASNGGVPARGQKVTASSYGF